MNKVLNRGFSLIEILIVVVIVAIVAGIAYPSYQNSVQKARRSDARAALAEAAALQEKWYFQQNQYTNDIDDVGGSTSPEGLYTLSVERPCGSSSCFMVIAQADGVQSDDTDCLVFTLDNTRQKKSYSDVARSAETQDCW